MEGELSHWHRLADRQSRSLQECMESNTSTEFLQWNAYYEVYEWQFAGPVVAQLALVASEVRQLTLTLEAVFGGKGTLPPLKDFFLTPELPVPGEELPSATEVDVEIDYDAGETAFDAYKPGAVEIGGELDEKWQKVNDSIKGELAFWASMIGPDGAQFKEGGE